MTQLPQKRMYVLDTNILLHDPFSLFKFAEHDIFIPMVTVEEMDNKKSGQLDVNRNARQATRLITDLVEQGQGSLSEGFALDSTKRSAAKGKLFLQSQQVDFMEGEHFHKNDNLYISVMKKLADQFPGVKCIMVSKDLNLRIKMHAMGIAAEDYRHDHVVDDADMLSRGITKMDMSFDAFIDDYAKRAEAADSGDFAVEHDEHHNTLYDISGVPHEFNVNEFLYFDDPSKPGLPAIYRVVLTDKSQQLDSVDEDLEHVNMSFVAESAVPRFMLKEVRNTNVLNIKPRNEEQAAALDLLMDDDIDMVALLGPAGTGKTLLSVAAGLYTKKFDKVLYTRTTVAMGEDIGFLPGTEEEKMAPWVGALMDNVEFLKEINQQNTENMSRLASSEKRIEIRSVSFMRGRTLLRRFIILDEAQNLTPKQIKGLVTRAGMDSKIVLLGNLDQIDSPYLSETSSGLAYAVERFKNWQHFGSIIMEKGERSRLANEANKRL